MVQAEQAASSAYDRGHHRHVRRRPAPRRARPDRGRRAYDRADRAATRALDDRHRAGPLRLRQGRLDAAIATSAAVVDRTPAPAAATLLGELQQAAGREADAAASFALAEAGTQLLVAAGSTVDLESAVFTADHGNPRAERSRRRSGPTPARRTVFTADALGWALTRAGRRRRSAALRRRGARPRHPLARAPRARRPRLRRRSGRTPRPRPRSTPPSPRRRGSSRHSGADAAGLADRLGVTVPPDWRP